MEIERGLSNIISLKQLAVKGVGMLFGKHSLSFVINFAGGIILARFFGPKIMGLYFVSYTLFIVYREIMDWGIYITYIRKEQEPTADEIKTAFTLQQILSACVLVMSLIVVCPIFYFIYKDTSIIFLIMSAAFGAYFYGLTKIPAALLERNLDYMKVSITELLEIIGFNFICVFMIVMKNGMLGLLLGNLARGLFPLAYIIYSGNLRAKLLFDFKGIKQLFFETTSIVGTNFSIWVVILAPPVILGAFTNAAVLGFVQLAYNVLNQAAILSTILHRVFLAFLSRVQGNMELFNKYVNKIFETFSVIYIIMIFGVASLSSWWAPLFYGKKWAGLENIIIIAAFPVAQTAVLGVFAATLFSLGKAKVVFKQTLLYGALYWVFTIVLVLLGTKQYSVPMAHLLSAQTGIIMIVFYVKNYGKIKWFNTLINFSSGYLIAVLSWYTLKKGNYIMPVVLWGVYLAFIYFRSDDIYSTVLNIKSLFADKTIKDTDYK